MPFVCPFKRIIVTLFAVVVVATTLHLPAQLKIGNTYPRYALVLDTQQFDQLA